jgi:hypothetical protein
MQKQVFIGPFQVNMITILFTITLAFWGFMPPLLRAPPLRFPPFFSGDLNFVGPIVESG